MTPKILVATRSFGSTSSEPWDVLAAAGCETVKADMTQKMTETHLVDLLDGIHGAIVGVVPMTARVMAESRDLKVVSAHGVGVDHIDLKAAAEKGVVIANCPGANTASVCDLTIGLMIAASRNIPAVDRAVRRGEWARYHGSELWRKTLGIVGLGHIGLGVAKRALGFDMTVLAHDPFIDGTPEQLPQIQTVSLDGILQQSDFVTLHAPLTNQTHHIIGSDELAVMKPDAYLINTARGGLVDEGALFKALSAGQIAGAAFDCFADEPPVNSPLLELENLVLTPHIGAHTKESIKRVGVMAAENVVAVLTGNEPHNRLV
jgi:D-3-phosphoglycerate dehydrogenase